MGVSRISGQMLAAHNYASILGIIAAMNIFLGLFNLLPVLPLDGGHIALSWLQKLRSRRPRLRANPVCHRVLLAVAYMLAAVIALFSLLNIAADFINPIGITR